MNKIKLDVGQNLWFEANKLVNHNAKDHDVTVVKVGRHWATLSNGCRIAMTDEMHADGGNHASPGRAWLSREACLADRHLRRRFAELANMVWAMRHRPPAFITIENIERVFTLLSKPDRTS